MLPRGGVRNVVAHAANRRSVATQSYATKRPADPNDSVSDPAGRLRKGMTTADAAVSERPHQRCCDGRGRGAQFALRGGGRHVPCAYPELASTLQRAAARGLAWRGVRPATCRHLLCRPAAYRAGLPFGSRGWRVPPCAPALRAADRTGQTGRLRARMLINSQSLAAGRSGCRHRSSGSAR